ncbi:MAG TPA: hypothetical protein DCK83_07075 [Gallionellaceae bacterium]|nr:hypothetical protein [Gallionellaceae bacterium]
MSRLVQYEQYDMMLSLRNGISQAVATGSEAEAHAAVGRLQGYLIGLHTAGEIEKGDVAVLEADMMSGIAFLYNARKAGHAH